MYYIFNADNNVRRNNVSQSTFHQFFPGSVICLHRLETVNASHYDSIEVQLELGHFRNLRNLNISHNQFDTGKNVDCLSQVGRLCHFA